MYIFEANLARLLNELSKLQVWTSQNSETLEQELALQHIACMFQASENTIILYFTPSFREFDIPLIFAL